MKENPLIIPGSFSLTTAYQGYEGIDIWLNNPKSLDTTQNKWLIAHSAGVNYILKKGILDNQKLILINPLIKKRNYFSLFIRDIRFFLNEGIEKDKLIPLSSWVNASIKVLKLLRVNVLKELQKIPKEKIFIVRGLQDTYFCDTENVELARKEGFIVFEVEARHNWNDNIERQVDEIIRSN